MNRRSYFLLSSKLILWSSRKWHFVNCELCVDIVAHSLMSRYRKTEQESSLGLQYILDKRFLPASVNEQRGISDIAKWRSDSIVVGYLHSEQSVASGSNRLLQWANKYFTRYAQAMYSRLRLLKSSIQLNTVSPWLRNSHPLTSDWPSCWLLEVDCDVAGTWRASSLKAITATVLRLAESVGVRGRFAASGLDKFSEIALVGPFVSAFRTATVVLLRQIRGSAITAST